MAAKGKGSSTTTTTTCMYMTPQLLLPRGLKQGTHQAFDYFEEFLNDYSDALITQEPTDGAEVRRPDEVTVQVHDGAERRRQRLRTVQVVVRDAWWFVPLYLLCECDGSAHVSAIETSTFCVKKFC